jgi:hypothetical protein
LTKGSDAELKKAADDELSGPMSAKENELVGDGWWAVADKVGESESATAREHAASFYAIALNGTTGLARMKMLDRVAKVSDGRSEPAKESAKEPASLLTFGSAGHGDLYSQGSQGSVDALVKIVARDQKSALISVTRLDNGETFLIRCSVSSSALAIQGVEQSKPPRRLPPFTVERLNSGDASLQNGSLNLFWSVQGSSKGMPKHREWHVAVKNIKLKED